jgi:hypothetical protein
MNEKWVELSMSNLKYIHTPHSTINTQLINIPLLITVVLSHIHNAQGCAGEGRASKEARLAAYKMLSQQNCWN